MRRVSSVIPRPVGTLPAHPLVPTPVLLLLAAIAVAAASQFASMAHPTAAALRSPIPDEGRGEATVPVWRPPDIVGGRLNLNATYPPGTRTGVTVVDRILGVVERQNGGSLAALVEYWRVPCGPHVDGTYDETPCPPGVPARTLVDAFAAGNCDGGLMSGEFAPAALVAFAAKPHRLYAVYRTKGDAAGGRGYAIVFAEPPDATGGPTAVVDLGQRGVRGLAGTCGDPPASAVGFVTRRRWVLPPAGLPPTRLHAASTRTGNEAVDSVLNAAFARDWRSLVRLAQFERWSCDPNGSDLARRCTSDEAPEATVRLFRIRTCDGGSFTRRQTAAGAPARQLRHIDGVYAVQVDDPGRVTARRMSFIVFGRALPDGGTEGTLVVLRGDRVSEVMAGCGREPWQFPVNRARPRPLGCGSCFCRSTYRPVARASKARIERSSNLLSLTSLDRHTSDRPFPTAVGKG